ncbi:MAG TPA: DUF4267 domain-containing protein [Pseudonocardiaceae bacterium]|jgi:hypothetical protein
MLVHIADGIVGLVGVGIIAIGIRFMLQPQAAATGYGVSAPPGPGVYAYLCVKGLRDITLGLATLGLLFVASPHILGLLIILEAVSPIGDAVIVLANKGKPAVALGVHAATAAVMIAFGIVLLVS